MLSVRVPLHTTRLHLNLRTSAFHRPNYRAASLSPLLIAIPCSNLTTIPRLALWTFSAFVMAEKPFVAPGSLLPAKRTLLKDFLRNNFLGSSSVEISDVTLVSCDGKRFPSVRAILAMRSPYFRSVFFGGYAEEKRSEVKLTCNGEVIEQILEYVYTDDCEILNVVNTVIGKKGIRKRKSGEAFAEDITARRVVCLVDVIIACDYLQINDLAEVAVKAVDNLVQSVRKVACLVLELVNRQPEIQLLKGLKEAALKTIRSFPRETLLVEDYRVTTKKLLLGKNQESNVDKQFVENGVLILGKGTLQEILSDQDLFTSETYLFQVLFFWATDGEHLHSLEPLKPAQSANKDKKLRNKDSSTQGSAERSLALFAGKRDSERWNEAKKLVKHIKLDKVKPSFIRDFVELTGLVDENTFLDIYRRQAMEAERGRPLFDSFRGGSVWKNGTKTWREESSQYKSRYLSSPWLETGRHEWVFKLVKVPDEIFLGVYGNDRGFTSEAEFFANFPAGSAYGNAGTLVVGGHKLKRRGPIIGEGQTVKVILNLMRAGSLTIMAEGTSKSYSAFWDLKASACRFKPAMFSMRPATVTLISESHSLS